MSEAEQALAALKTLSEQINEQQLRSEERLKAQHGRFNVFTTLLAAHDEVRLHTRFLHELLNPEGTHDCGDLFLKLFFETLHAKGALAHDDAALEKDWKHYDQTCRGVGKEVSTQQGQLDLLLEFDSHVLVIENKIWAGEQERQLARYIDYVESQAKAGQVLYLTLDGKAATTHEGKDYLRISYKEHILAWLERCLQATYAIVPVNQALIQYRKVVKQLTGQTLETQAMEPIKKFIRQHPQIITSRESVNQGIAALRVEVRNRFAEALSEALDDTYFVKPRSDMHNNNFGEDAYADLIIRPRANDFTAPHHDAFEIWIENVDARWTGLIIGIESGWKKKRPLREDEKALLQTIFEKFCAHFNNVCATDKVSWNGTHWPCSWHGLIHPFMENDASFAQMLDEAHFKSQVQKAADGVRDYMKLLEQFYKEANEPKGSNDEV